MAINGIDSALAGMYASQVQMDKSANNVANINTNTVNAGDAVGATRTNAGPAYINDLGQTNQASATYAPPRPGGTPPTQGTNNTAATMAATQPTNTDMVREMTNQMSARNAYGAAVGLARTSDEMNQTLLNVVR